MVKVFPIDFVRQILEQKLEEEHLKNVNLYGGKNQVAITSFYEQLKTQDEVDRFVDNYRDLTEQQNRTGLILNGVIVSPENPTITNLYSSLIIPMVWTCSLRCRLEDRDNALITINNLIEKLKGRKVDIAQLNSRDNFNKPISVPFMVGTLGQNDGDPIIKNGDFLGSLANIGQMSSLVTSLTSKGLVFESGNKKFYYYVNNDGILRVVERDKTSGTNSYSFVNDDGSIKDIIFPPEHTSFEKFKVSMSFDAIRCDEPRNLNEKEYCEISFGGSATLVSEGVQLGNDLLKVNISKLGIKAKTPIDFATNNRYPNWWLEPLELPSGSNANTQLNQLVSNRFLNNSHTDALSLTLQYSFVYDNSISLLKQLFEYARYGTQGLTSTYISPNMIFGITEIWSSWGEFEYTFVRAKIVENIDIENTESDTLTISVVMQIQGENN